MQSPRKRFLEEVVMEEGCRWCPFPGEPGPAGDITGVLLASRLLQVLLLGALPNLLEAWAATFPCVYFPVINLLYKTRAVICVERLAGGVNRPFTDTRTPTYREFGEAPPLDSERTWGQSPTWGFVSPFVVSAAAKSFPSSPAASACVPFQLGGASFGCITCGDER